MKMFIRLSIAMGMIAVLPAAKATTLAEWTFETTHPVGERSGGVWFTNLSAEVGSGTASAWHSGVTVYFTYPGNGSSSSLSASNSWSVGDFSQFAVSTTGYQDLSISFDQTGSASSPGAFYLAYSLDGISFTKFGGDYAVSLGNWNSTTVNPASAFSFDLHSINAINNQPLVYFRVVDDSAIAINGGAVMPAGNDKLDNFLVSAQPVPEPTVGMLGLFGGICSLWVLGKRR